MDTPPANLGEAMASSRRAMSARDALGDHVFHNFVSAKKKEWAEYIAQVTDWEVGQYLSTY